MTAPSHIAPQLTLCLAITRRLRAYLPNQLAPACSGSSHSDIGVSGREVFGKEGVLFRQNWKVYVFFFGWKWGGPRTWPFQGKLLSNVSKRVQWAQVGKSVRVWLSQRRKQHCLLLCCCSRVEDLLLVLLPDIRSLGKRSQWPVGRAAGERSQENWVSCVYSGSAYVLGCSHELHTQIL